MEKEIYETACALLGRYSSKDVLAESYGIEPGSEVVYRSTDLPDSKNKQLNINVATEFGLNCDPPFEWKLEITFYDPDSHFLLLPDGRFVRTERKDFFDATPDELERINKSLKAFA